MWNCRGELYKRKMKKVKSNNDEENHEIQLEGEYAEILSAILNKYGFKYTLNDKKNISGFNIYDKDVGNIYRVLKYEMLSDGMNSSTGGLNDYGAKIDDLISEFSTLGAKLGLKPYDNDKKKLEIHIGKAKTKNAKTLIYILNKHGYKYTFNGWDDKSFLFNIYKKDIDNIYNMLMDEMAGNGVEKDTTTNRDFLNDYGRTVDSFIGIFSAIKYNLKPPSAEKAIIHEIHIMSENAELLSSILNKYGFKYTLNDQKNNISIFNIYEKDIGNIYNILIDEMTGVGIDSATKGFNDYGYEIDNILGGFAALNGKLNRKKYLKKRIFLLIGIISIIAILLSIFFCLIKPELIKKDSGVGPGKRTVEHNI
jgi:hypothetical protein